MYEHILVEKTAGVAILTMNRPEQLNAMNHRLSTELHDAVLQMNADDEVGCIVITGAGTRAFSAGGDIHEQRENDRTYSQAELDERNAVRLRGSYEISASAKPTIGMMNGLAYGGAGVLATSLDMRVGCEHASGSSPSPTAASTPRGRCRTRWGGPSRRSSCSRGASWRRKRRTASGSSTTSCHARSSGTRRSSSGR